MSLLGLVGVEVLVGCGGGGSSTGGDTLTQGLIHWWKFDGNANDSVGSLSSTPIGPVTYANAINGQGIVFDGSTTGISLPAASDLQFQGSFSVSAWARLESYPSDAQIWSTIIFDGDDRTGNDPWYLQVSPTGELEFAITSSSSFGKVDGTMPLGRFVFVAGTYDRSTGTESLYVDGVKVAERFDTTLTPVVALVDSEHPGVGIGTNNAFPNSIYNMGWNGTIDDLRIYNRALSSSEVASLYALRPAAFH